MKERLLFLFITLAFSILVARGESPIPVVVPANQPTAPVPAAATTVQAPAAQQSDSLSNALKAMAEMKAANAEILKKQEAMLQQLDELQKAAEQLKIFSKRG